MSYDWCRLWWQFYGTGKALRVFMFSAGDQVVAILPIYLQSIGFGALRITVARLVGANVPPKVFNPPIHAEFAQPAFSHVLAHLFHQDACDMLSFGPVSDLYRPSESFLAACGQPIPQAVRSTQVSNGVHTVWALPQTLEAYYQSLSRNERKNRKSDMKKLQAGHGAQIEVVREPAKVQAEFEQFAQQHAAQWAAEGRTGHFGAWPHGLEYNRALVKTHGQLGRVRFVRIRTDQETIANLYAFAFGDCYFCELPARSIHPQWDRLSLGPAVILATVQAAIGERMTRMEGGLGHYDYKLRLNAGEHRARVLRVVANRPASRLRCTLFTILRSCGHLGYQKAWHQRLLPHVPASLKRPQSRAWLNLDF